MTIYKPLAAATCLIMSACAFETPATSDPRNREDLPYDDSDTELGSEEVGVSVQNLESWRTGRTREDYRTAVYLKNLGCSGAIIAPDLIMTAAHCVNHFPNGWQFYLYAEGVFDDSAQGYLSERHCITSLSQDKSSCGNNVYVDAAFVQVFWNTDFREDSDSIDSSTDVAVIKLLDKTADDRTQIRPNYRRPFFYGYAPDVDCEESGERLNKTPCYQRIITSAPATGAWMQWNGWGSTRDNLLDGGTKLNFGLTKIDWVGSGHYLRNTEESDLERGCYGDSGGPSVVDNDNWGISGKRIFLLGINSSMSTPSGQCADPGGKERWARAGKHLFLINNPGNHASRPGAGRSCSSFTVAGHSYIKCYNEYDWF